VTSPRDGGGMVNLRIFRCLKPVIAAINGAGVGFGATLPLSMDIRLAAEGAKFGFVFSRRGMCLDGAASWFLPRIVGMSRALEWAMSGRIFGADEALEAGLIRSIHPPDKLLPAAYALARELTEHSAPVSVALNRQLLWQMAAPRIRWRPTGWSRSTSCTALPPPMPRRVRRHSWRSARHASR